MSSLKTGGLAQGPEEKRGFAGRAVDVRVSTMPSGHGERVVLRLLDKQAGRLDLVHLGLGADGHTASLVPGDPVLSVVDADGIHPAVAPWEHESIPV